MNKKIVLCILFILFLFSINCKKIVKNLEDMTAITEESKKEIEKEIGGEILMTWNLSNNVAYITIKFNKLPDEDIYVKDLKDKIRIIVEDKFKDKKIGKIIIII